uniref:Uncharacterized protein n=1 Tax=Heterorhabditis bacteriophora TaxID=37862 RepID=A0A1I7XEH1_HETBA
MLLILIGSKRSHNSVALTLFYTEKNAIPSNTAICLSNVMGFESHMMTDILEKKAIIKDVGSVPFKNRKASAFLSPSSCQTRPMDNCSTIVIKIAASAILMTIVEQLSIGRVWQEEGERNADAFRFLKGTDPTLQIPLRTTYATRPAQDSSDQ